MPFRTTYDGRPVIAAGRSARERRRAPQLPGRSNRPGHLVRCAQSPSACTTSCHPYRSWLGAEISAPPASPQSGQAPKRGFLMIQQRLAYLACRPPDCGKTVLEAAGSDIAAPDREGLAFSDARQANMPVSIGRVRSRQRAEPASEGPKPPVGSSSLMNRRIATPCAVPGESLSGILPSKELLCAYPRQ